MPRLEYYHTILGVNGFRWNDWNLEQATKHGCGVTEIEQTIRRELSRGKFLVQADDSRLIHGRGNGGRMLEIAFVIDPPDASAIYDQTIYVIHAMPLSTRRRRRKL